MTACAYLLRTPAELQQYFRFYLRKIRKVTGSYKYSGMMHWDRALAELLIANSEMLKYISTEDCNSCLKNQMILLSSYTDYYEPKYKLAYGVLKVCLFLLMRRKYDKSFLAEGCEVRKKVEKRLNRAIRSNDQKVSGWSTILLQFIQGNGMIKDLPNVL